MIPPFLYKWIAIAVVIIGLSVVLFVERNLRIAAEKGEKAAVELARLKSEDADRWQIRSAQGDAIILDRTAALNQQSAEIEKGRAKEQALSAALSEASQRNITLQQTADQLSRELDDESSKAPADVRDLGPIVLRRAPGLFN